MYNERAEGRLISFWYRADLSLMCDLDYNDLAKAHLEPVNYSNAGK